MNAPITTRFRLCDIVIRFPISNKMFKTSLRNDFLGFQERIDIFKYKTSAPNILKTSKPHTWIMTQFCYN